MVVFLKLLQVAVFTDQRKSTERRWLLSKQGLLLLILALSKSQTVEGSKDTLWSVVKGDDAQASITFSLSAGARAFLMMACVFVAPQANPSVILLSGNIFLHSFVKWSPAENAKMLCYENCEIQFSCSNLLIK